MCMQTTTNDNVKWPTAIRSGLVSVGSALLILLTISACSFHPEAIAPGTALEQAGEDVARISEEQLLPSAPIDLYEAMARAVLYNRERRLALMETALSQGQADMARLDMLPSFAANAGYLGRNSYNSSSSVSTQTGTESLEPSYSTEKDYFTSDVTFTWNVLDFGLSYVRANQQGDRHLIAMEKERKAIHLLLRDVRKAWWEALTAQRLIGRLDELSGKVQKVLDESEQMEKQQLQSPLNALGFQRSLMKILRSLHTLRQDLSGSPYMLAALMGLPPGIEFSVKDPGEYPDMVTPDWQKDTLEQIALTLRTELMESRYEGRIASQEAHAALLSLLPGIDLDFGWNGDTNKYLVENTWWNWGTHIGFNLLNVFKAPAALRNADNREKVAEERRLALSMTVLMQVHLARLNHIMALQAYQLDDKYYGIQNRIMKQTVHNAAVLKGESTVIREELAMVLAEVRRSKAYADLQDSYGRILVSVGIDPIGNVEPGVTVDELKENIRDNIENWDQQKMSTMLDSLRPDVESSLPGVDVDEEQMVVEMSKDTDGDFSPQVTVREVVRIKPSIANLVNIIDEPL